MRLINTKQSQHLDKDTEIFVVPSSIILEILDTLRKPNIKIAQTVFQTIKLAAAAAFQTNISIADSDPV